MKEPHTTQRRLAVAGGTRLGCPGPKPLRARTSALCLATHPPCTHINLAGIHHRSFCEGLRCNLAPFPCWYWYKRRRLLPYIFFFSPFCLSPRFSRYTERHPLQIIIPPQPDPTFDSTWTGWPRAWVDEKAGEVLVLYSAGGRDMQNSTLHDYASTGLRRS